MITIKDKTKKRIERYRQKFYNNWEKYYTTKTNAKDLIKDIILLTKNEEDKNFFIKLKNVIDTTADLNLITNIYKFSNYYFKVILQQKQLNKQQLNNYINIKNRLIKQLKEKENKKRLLHKNTNNIILHILKNEFKLVVVQEKLELKNKHKLNEKLDKYKDIKSKINNDSNNLMELKLELKNLINKSKKER